MMMPASQRVDGTDVDLRHVPIIGWIAHLHAQWGGPASPVRPFSKRVS